MNMNICYTEIGVDNVERAQKFYSELFGWKFEKVPAPMDYWMVSMPECKEECKVQPVGIGMMKKTEGHPGHLNYISVPAIDEYSKKVEKLGGKVLGAKQAVPGFGYFATCQDTEGTTFALWKSDKNAQ